jgi:hypothetical protein
VQVAKSEEFLDEWQLVHADELVHVRQKYMQVLQSWFPPSSKYLLWQRQEGPLEYLKSVPLQEVQVAASEQVAQLGGQGVHVPLPSE